MELNMEQAYRSAGYYHSKGHSTLHLGPYDFHIVENADRTTESSQKHGINSM